MNRNLILKNISAQNADVMFGEYNIYYSSYSDDTPAHLVDTDIHQFDNSKTFDEQYQKIKDSYKSPNFHITFMTDWCKVESTQKTQDPQGLFIKEELK